MKFSIDHSHLKSGDYCWAINNKGTFPEIELVQLHYDSSDRIWFLNDGTEISGFLFGDKISVPEIWEFLGETWKMNRVPYAPTKIKLEQTY